MAKEYIYVVVRPDGASMQLTKAQLQKLMVDGVQKPTKAARTVTQGLLSDFAKIPRRLIVAGGSAMAFTVIMGTARRTVQQFREEFDKALEVAKEFAEMKAPQFMFAGGAGRDVKEWGLAQAFGMPAAEVGRMRTTLMAAMPAGQVMPTLRRALPFARYAGPEGGPQVAQGMASLRAAGLTQKESETVLFFLQRQARGQFGELVAPAARGVAMGRQGAIPLPRVMGMYGTITQQAGMEEPGTAMRAFRQLMVSLVKEPPKGLARRARAAGVDISDPNKLLDYLIQGIGAGDISPRESIAWFGGKRFGMPIYGALKDRPELQRRRALAEKMLTQGGYLERAIAQQYAPGTPAERDLRRRQAQQADQFESWQIEKAASAEELAQRDLSREYRMIGSGSKTLGWARTWGKWYGYAVGAGFATLGLGIGGAAAFMGGPPEPAAAAKKVATITAGLEALPGEGFVPGEAPGGLRAVQEAMRGPTPKEIPAVIQCVEENESTD